MTRQLHHSLFIIYDSLFSAYRQFFVDLGTVSAYIFCQVTLAKEGVNTDRRNTDKASKNRVFPIRVYKIDNFLSIGALLAPKIDKSAWFRKLNLPFTN